MINFIQAQSSIIYLGIFLLALCLITKENESKYSKKTKAMILLVIAVGAGVVKLVSSHS